jgi:nucleotide-binding universal stress UspA family protein
MSWTNVLVPMLGDALDAEMLAVAKALAAPFGATIRVAYCAFTPTSLFACVGEAGVGVTGVVLQELQRVSSDGECRSRDLLAALDYPHKAFDNVTADDWLGLRIASRLADVVVWSSSAAHGHGFFASAFQQIVMDERRPALIAERPLQAGGLVAIAWDGGRESSRAARRAVPWLQKAEEVVVVTAFQAMAHPCEPHRLLSYLADQGVKAQAMAVHTRGEAGPIILETVRALGAGMLVAGAFAHPRLQRFIFGGTTQALLDGAPAAALLLSH